MRSIHILDITKQKPVLTMRKCWLAATALAGVLLWATWRPHDPVLLSAQEARAGRTPEYSCDAAPLAARCAADRGVAVVPLLVIFRL
jgi:hypothetical protein